jgi:hypothetical protein
MIDEVFDELYSTVSISSNNVSACEGFEDHLPQTADRGEATAPPEAAIPLRESYIPPGPSLWDALSADPVVRDSNTVTMKSSSGWDEWERTNLQQPQQAHQQHQPSPVVDHRPIIQVDEPSSFEIDDEYESYNAASEWREMKPMQRRQASRSKTLGQKIPPPPTVKLSSMMEDEDSLPEHLRFIPTVNLLSLSSVEDSRHSARLDALDLDPSRSIRVRTGRFSTKKK